MKFFYWSKLIFTGKGQPPRSAKPGRSQKLVANNPNTIAYIDKGSVDSSVKVVSWLSKATAAAKQKAAQAAFS